MSVSPTLSRRRINASRRRQITNISAWTICFWRPRVITRLADHYLATREAAGLAGSLEEKLLVSWCRVNFLYFITVQFRILLRLFHIYCFGHSRVSFVPFAATRKWCKPWSHTCWITLNERVNLLISFQFLFWKKCGQIWRCMLPGRRQFFNDCGRC